MLPSTQRRTDGRFNLVEQHDLHSFNDSFLVVFQFLTGCSDKKKRIRPDIISRLTAGIRPDIISGVLTAGIRPDIISGVLTAGIRPDIISGVSTAGIRPDIILTAGIRPHIVSGVDCKDSPS